MYATKMSESNSNSKDTTDTKADISGAIRDRSKEESVYVVTDRHTVDLAGGTCTCIEDYLFDGPCRHRRKVAKRVTRSGSETSQ